MFGKLRGFTLIELLVVIAIIAILAAILFPIFMSAQESARQARCGLQAKQLGLAIVRYGDDYNGWIVKSANPTPKATVLWPTILKPYYKCTSIEVCPSRPARKSTSITTAWGIGLNHPNICGYWDAERRRFTDIKSLPRTVVAGDVGLIKNPNAGPDQWVESDATWIFRTPGNEPYYSSVGAERMIGRHNGRTNAIFLDGHAKAMKVSEIGFQYAQKDPKALWDQF